MLYFVMQSDCDGIKKKNLCGMKRIYFIIFTPKICLLLGDGAMLLKYFTIKAFS